MHPRVTVQRARELYAAGLPVRAVAEHLGVPQRTVHHWCTGSRRGGPRRTRARCFRCEDRPVPDGAYAYLLGMYLGDGHITATPRSHCLWIYCANDRPGILDDVRSAVTDVLPGAMVSLAARRTGCTAVKCWSHHWICLFPQHGPGMKHTRPIRLEPWQQRIVEACPGPFLKGLFHSDGCRATNRVRARRPDGTVGEYAYPRWFLANTSEDILRLAEDALDLLGIAHRRNRPTSLSVARREAVAALDAAIGPKT